MSTTEADEKEVYPMSVTSPGWQQHLQHLLAAPADSAEHHLGEDLIGADDEKAWSLLTDMITQDPPATAEYQSAARTVGFLIDSVVA